MYVLRIPSCSLTTLQTAPVAHAAIWHNFMSPVSVAFSLPNSSVVIDEGNDYTISAKTYTKLDVERQLEYITT